MSQHSRFPVLTLIDTVRSSDTAAFATDPEATALERRARQLTDEFWPEQAFLTGNIAQPLVDAVVRRLDDERRTLHRGIRVFVESEQATTPLA